MGSTSFFYLVGRSCAWGRPPLGLWSAFAVASVCLPGDEAVCSYRPIVDYIDAQFENYLQEELKIRRSLFDYHDTRIHVCLYFITPTGHSLKSLDLVTMKKLDSKVYGPPCHLTSAIFLWKGVWWLHLALPCLAWSSLESWSCVAIIELFRALFQGGSFLLIWSLVPCAL